MRTPFAHQRIESSKEARSTMNHPQLDVLRKQLDELDEQLISIVAERFRITAQVGEYKSKHDLAAVDATRERSQIERIRKLAEEYGVDGNMAQKVIRIIINAVVKRHKAIVSNPK